MAFLSVTGFEANLLPGTVRGGTVIPGNVLVCLLCPASPDDVCEGANVERLRPSQFSLRWIPWGGISPLVGFLLGMS